jgi:hypothetical protein
MKKYWAVLLLAIAATQAVAGEKEYTIRQCGKSAVQQSCDKCKELENAKMSFKVSKDLKSVMQTSTKLGNAGIVTVIDDCKIFDENNLQCKTETAARYEQIGSNYFYNNYGITDTLTLANGKWEAVAYFKGVQTTYSKEDGYFIQRCGYEIKNVFNFF